MTKRRYDKTTDLSRSATPSDRRRHRRRKALGAETGPFSGAFEALQPESEEHPVDVIVDRIPLIARLGRDLTGRSNRFRQQVRSSAKFIAYEDLRLHVRTERESAYYNIGHGHGLVRGRAEALASNASREAVTRRFAEVVLAAAFKENLPATRIATALLEVAYAYVLGLASKAPTGVRLAKPKSRTVSRPASS